MSWWIWAKNSISRMPPRPRFTIDSRGRSAWPLRIMVADPPGDRPDLADRPEIERAAPDERMDRVEEIAPERRVARRRPGRG